MKVEEALEDPDWVNAMHEELHNIERNQVWTLVEKPTTSTMSLEPNGCFKISKIKMDKLYATRPISSLKATLQSKVWTMVSHMPPLLDLSPYASYLLMPITMISLYTKWTLKVLF